ncbi:DUF2500 domain-containing protein [Antrihabitans sp. YC2-6]|uniref:DUF2500 domain-containing protein n=1 Tax=Antrihabitans sp. YC2-6 TaxID=2799498 RepID=UPI0018F5213B|nr:DUF2500 domain-containing protein [Antrihabitans sp. YC2-6]MBJ8344345.1 DUF2500 domain-containing protein [Antrihabitans sp. YC2-6]
MEDLGLVFFVLVGTAVAGVFAFVIIGGVVQWLDNNQQPVLNERARAVTKRTDTSGHSDGPTSTTYFVTFQIGSGERREFRIRGKEYGKIAEGDSGELVYQGTRYKGFQRTFG